jgi:hypothetical protein
MLCNGRFEYSARHLIEPLVYAGRATSPAWCFDFESLGPSARACLIRHRLLRAANHWCGLWPAHTSLSIELALDLLDYLQGVGMGRLCLTIHDQRGRNKVWVNPGGRVWGINKVMNVEDSSGWGRMIIGDAMIVVLGDVMCSTLLGKRRCTNLCKRAPISLSVRFRSLMCRLLYILRVRTIHKDLIIFCDLALPCKTHYGLLIFNRFIVLPLVDHLI